MAFPESCMKKEKWWPAICNYKQPFKIPCVPSMKSKQSVIDLLCYSILNYVHFRPNKPMLQEFMDLLCMRNDARNAETYIYNYSDWKIACHWRLTLLMRCSYAKNIHLALLNGLIYIE